MKNPGFGFKHGVKHYTGGHFVPCSVEQAFDFHCSFQNLQKITPKWLNFRVTSNSSETMQEGSTVSYKLRIHGVPVSWTTRILEHERPHRFVDTQEKGPFSLWWHIHEFKPHVQDGVEGTWIEDIVYYRAPLGRLGSWVAGPYLRWDVNRIFKERRKNVHLALSQLDS